MWRGKEEEDIYFGALRVLGLSQMSHICFLHPSCGAESYGMERLDYQVQPCVNLPAYLSIGLLVKCLCLYSHPCKERLQLEIIKIC